MEHLRWLLLQREITVYSAHPLIQIPLNDLEKGMSNKDVAAKYGVPKNNLSTWVKNKEETFKFTRKRK